MKMQSFTLLALFGVAAASFAWGQSPSGSASPAAAPAEQSPIPAYHTDIPPAQRRVFFGEMHLHTQMSFDAWTFGTRTTPDQAYKFGKGLPITVNGVTAQRAWPLDFMAVTDHSEFMGAIAQLNDPDSEFSKTETGQQIRAGGLRSFRVLAAQLHVKPTPTDLANAAKASHAWDVQMKATQDNYEPGKFTTLLAYEWTGSSPQGGNLHRNVFFSSDKAPPPFSSSDSNIAEDLWDYLDSVRARGIDAIAIPHNGNASGGAMYDWNTYRGNKPMDEAYVQRRAMEEPLTEIVQNKGQSDTVPELSPNDEFANFEIYDHLIAQPTKLSAAHGSYIREAFGRGLVIESKVGANPYKYGVVGASDFHNGLSASDENAFAGGAFGIDPKTMSPSAAVAKHTLTLGTPPLELDADAASSPEPVIPAANKDRPVRGTALENSGSGLTGLWAEENDRGAIFAALKRKETFATSGTRIRVRVFGGWGFEPKIIQDRDWVGRAYAEGVPMGSDLPAKPAEAHAPRFILQAAKDPDGANLDRIQIIKLWLDGGTYKEKIFDVALSGKRRIDRKTGKAAAVGNTVDLKNGTYRNTIGAAEFTTVWSDPEFDVTKPAVYYTRTLEIPTPRWSTLLAVRNGLPIPQGIPPTIQERAWTSPIWYTPVKTD